MAEMSEEEWWAVESLAGSQLAIPLLVVVLAAVLEIASSDH